jgi:nucleotide-binding universal stress UspA family protein
MNNDLSRPMVVGVDSSTSASAAVNVAAEEAVAYGVPLRIVHAYAWPILYAALANVPYRPQDWHPAEASESAVTAVAGRLQRQHPGLAIQTAVTTGSAGTVLVDESRHATAVVVGARGAGGIAGMLTGSVTAHVAAHARCPAIVVREGQQTLGRTEQRGRVGAHGQVVVGVDGTDSSLDALRFACGWGQRHGAAVTAVYAVPQDQFDRPMPEFGLRTPAELRLEDWVAPVRAEFPVAQIRLSALPRRSPGEALTAASASARLVVVGSRHRGELLSAMLGSVGATLIRASACPVVVVHGGHMIATGVSRTDRRDGANGTG